MRDIVIYQKANKLPEGLRTVLRDSGYSFQTVFKFFQAVKELAKANDPVFVVDCGSDSKSTSVMIKTLLSKPSVHDYPLVVIGADPDRYTTLLSNTFDNFVFLGAPSTGDDVLGAITKLLGNKTPRVLEPSPEDSKTAHPAYANGKSVEAAVTEQFQETGLKNRNVGGNRYQAYVNAATLTTMQILPTDEETLDIVDDVILGLNQRESMHLFRTAMVTSRCAVALKVPQLLRDKATSAAILQALSFHDRSRRLLSVNYLKYNSQELRSTLAQKVKQSADQMHDLGKVGIADIIDKVSHVIEHDAVPNDDDHWILASVIASADIMDRYCFHSGFWDPYAAHQLVRRIRGGALNHVNPLVLSCILKFLLEAIRAHKPSFLVGAGLRCDPTLGDKLHTNCEPYIGRDELRVELDALSPGMRITRPVRAYDGKEVLSSHVTLDDDLIWRLWQLAAIKPLHSTLVVERR